MSRLSHVHPAYRTVKDFPRRTVNGVLAGAWASGLYLLLLAAAITACDDAPGSQSRAKVDLAPVVAPEAAGFLIRAQEAFEAGNPHAALALTDSAEQRAGSGNAGFLADVNFLRARVHTEVHRDDLAEAAYERVLVLDPDYRGVWLNLGNAAYRNGEYSDALAHYRRELASHPTADIQVFIGRAYAELGKVDSARSAYEQALEMDGTSASAHIRMAELLEKDGDPVVALVHAKQALEQDPGNPNYTYFIGTLLMRTHQLEEAARTFRTVLKQQPDRQAAHYNLGQALVRLGRQDEARVHLAVADSLFKLEHELRLWETKTQVDPQNPAVWATYGYALRRTGRNAEALRAYGVALHLDPSHLDVRYELANLYLKLGQVPRAAEQYDILLAQDSTYVGAWVNAGIAYARMGQPDAARRAWQTALRLEPGHPQAARYLAQLQSR